MSVLYLRKADTALLVKGNAAARMALALARGEGLDRIATDHVRSEAGENVPAILATPVPVTLDTIDSTIVEDGLYTVDQICTPNLRPACERAGIA
jgi:D-xylose transport system substrate-binding protein